MTCLNYKCLKCGNCCYDVPRTVDIPAYKRIPLYPEEAEVLIEIAKKNGIDFKVIEDLVFLDKKNKKILVVTYRIRLDNENKCCPFYNSKIGCMVHEVKPLSCQAYPLSLKRIDAFNFEISIDSLCNFVIQNYEELKNSDLNKIKQIFKQEYPKALNHLNKNKKIMLEIRKLEYEKKIEIYREVKIIEFNNFLKDWEREELIV